MKEAVLWALLPLFSPGVTAWYHKKHVRVPSRVEFQPGTVNCTEMWINVTTNHFSWTPSTTYESVTFPLRYFVYDGFYQGSGSPIWFYTGNEGDVTGYVDATGLMWENAESRGALLVFAEHRFYGETWPCGGMESALEYCMHLLTHEQAMADYVQLLAALRQEGGLAAGAGPVIAFGGSYGGMLSAWMRMKYPGTISGAIAASAPILGFPGLAFYDGSRPGGEAYWDIVQADMTPTAGAAEGCTANAHKAFQEIATQSTSEKGRQSLEEVFGLCPGQLSDSDADGYRLQMHVVFAYDDYAMGNYPFSSTYISGDYPLPPFPMRVACEFLGGVLEGEELLAATAASVNLLYNSSGAEECFALADRNDFLDGIWDYQWCTQLMCQETYFTRGSKESIFPPYQFNMSFVVAHCSEAYSVTPRSDWIKNSYGGETAITQGQYKNIVFSNGQYDPWRAAGVNDLNASDHVVSVYIEEGAHHLDLMFSTEQDPKSVTEARKIELAHIDKWTREWIAG